MSIIINVIQQRCNMYKTNLEERVIVKLGSILQSRNATKEDVLSAYAEVECKDEALETDSVEQQ